MIRINMNINFPTKFSELKTREGLCLWVGGCVALFCVLAGFWKIFYSARYQENDMKVIQEQLRGFAIFLFSGIAVAFAGLSCNWVGKQFSF
jgi:hypothetical protein